MFYCLSILFFFSVRLPGNVVGKRFCFIHCGNPVHADGNFSFGSFGPRAYQTYESNIQFALRFMIDCDIMGASWLEV